MAATHKTIEALRRLAERPGYQTEGALAAQRLGELRKTKPELFSAASSPLISTVFLDIHYWRQFQCACGEWYDAFGKCEGHVKHEHIRMTTAVKFKKGMSVFYNCWAYMPNSPAIVVGMPRPALDNWCWIKLQFDHLKSRRNVPIYSNRGCHLSLEPLSKDECRRLSMP